MQFLKEFEHVADSSLWVITVALLFMLSGRMWDIGRGARREEGREGEGNRGGGRGRGRARKKGKKVRNETSHFYF